MQTVFILGTDGFNLDQLKTVAGAEDCEFHSLAPYEQIRAGPEYPVREVLEHSRAALRKFPGRIDAIIGWWDFPVSTMLPILRREFDLPGPTLESLLKCEHKFWSRLEQSRCIPDHVPRFADVNPFDDTAADSVPLAFPFWLKPVKSASSYLGFRIDDRSELQRALAITRERIHELAEPFNHILAYARLPPEIEAVDGRHCIAEEIISRGRQCTLEGYVHRGQMEVYGVVDSIREGPHRSSFSRYQYPSTWPRRARERVIGLTARFLDHMGFDDSPFNAEYYWDPDSDAVWLLEINTRISKSHAPLFRMVDGSYHHQVMLDVALGREPEFPHRSGPFKVAAKFMLRRSKDARVTRTPDDDDVAAVKARFPYTEVEVLVHEGMRLSELRRQDSYSYEVAVVFMGADGPTQLLDNYRQAVQMLGMEFAEAGG